MACTNCPNPKITCGEIYNANCIKWEIPSNLRDYLDTEPQAEAAVGQNQAGGSNFSSSLKDEDCSQLSDVLLDIYEKFKAIETDLDLSDWESDCIDLGAVRKTLPVILTAINVELCSLKTTVEGLDSFCEMLDGTTAVDCGINYTCLIDDACGNPIPADLSIKGLLQLLIDKICALQGEVAAL